MVNKYIPVNFDAFKLPSQDWAPPPPCKGVEGPCISVPEAPGGTAAPGGGRLGSCCCDAFELGTLKSEKIKQLIEQFHIILYANL